jgi:LemA protein
MNNKRYSGYIIGAIVLVLVIFSISVYNSLVNKQEQVKFQWNEVQNAYQRRIDLIPNLVNVVKGQTQFEQSTLTMITEARARASSMTTAAAEPSAETYRQQSAAQDQLAAATNRLMVRVEKYPELKGAAAFEGLQTQLEGTERRIKVARKDFNGAVAGYNGSVRGFPAKLVAGLFGFRPMEGFRSDEGADRAVEIKF